MPPLRIRRATLDDLASLKALWSAANLAGDELENRLKEFHVVEHDGRFAGAFGVQIVRQHMRFHSEDYTDFAVADAARQLIWERIQTLAANHGVFRLWTQETSPFWTHWGFQPATPESMERLPDEWKTLEGPGAPERSKGGWLTLELKDEEAINAALGGQFAGAMDAEKKQTSGVAESARKLRLAITIAGFAIFIVCAIVAVYLLLHHPLSPRR